MLHSHISAQVHLSGPLWGKQRTRQRITRQVEDDQTLQPRRGRPFWRHHPCSPASALARRASQQLSCYFKQTRSRLSSGCFAE